MDNFLSSFFKNNDCVIDGDRVYSIVRESNNDYVEFMGTRFGLATGPTFSELEKHNIFHEKKTLEKKVDKIVQEVLKTAKKGSKGPDISTDKMRLRYVACDFMKRYSFRQISDYDFSKMKEIDDTKSTLEQLGEIKRSLLGNTDGGYLKESLSQPALILGGVAYALAETSSQRTNDVYVRIKGTDFHVSRGTSLGIDKLVSRSYELLDTRIRKKIVLQTEEIRKYIESDLYREAEGQASLTEVYDPERNIGFMDRTEGFFIYTRIPEYILLEHKSKRHYKFPPATIAVQIVAGMNGVNVFNPVVVEPYRHPAIYDKDKPFEYICFQYVKEAHSWHFFPTIINIKNRLFMGCKMMMTQYRSSGGAFNNIDREDTSADFQDMEVPEYLVDKRLVTNLSACNKEGNRYA